MSKTPLPGYFPTKDGKITKVTEDGLRINVYPNGVVTNQQPGTSHSDYKKAIKDSDAKK